MTEEENNPKTIEACPECKGEQFEFKGKPYCKTCADKKFEKENIYRIWIKMITSCMSICMPVVLTGVVCFSGIFYISGGSSKNNLFWVFLAFPVAFSSAFPVFVSVRRIIWQIYWRYKRSPDGPVGWFDISHAIRDVSLISASVAFMFSIASYFFSESLPASGVVFHQSSAFPFINVDTSILLMWFIRRGTFLFLISTLCILLLSKIRLINTAAFLPRGNLDFNMFWGIFYALLLPFPYLIIQEALSAIAKIRPNTDLLIVSMSVFVVCILMFIYFVILSRNEMNRINSNINSMPAVLAMVGESDAGKTVFLARSWAILSRWRDAEFALRPGKSGGNDILAKIIDTMEINNIKPNITLDFEDCPFILSHLAEDTIHFSWLDIAGGAFKSSNRTPEQEMARERFFAQLTNADCVMMVVPAKKLLGGNLQFEPYHDVADRLYQQRRGLGKATQPVHLAVVITQCCRLSPRQRWRLEERVNHLCRRWIMMADKKSVFDKGKLTRLIRPSVRVWKTSAIITKPDDREGNPAHFPPPAPHKSDNCAEPILWLTAQVMRNHIGMLERTAGFNNRSELQDMILRIEAIVNAKALSDGKL